MSNPPVLAIVSGLDPDNTVLFDRYDEIVDELRDLSFDDLQALGRDEALNVVNADSKTLRALLTPGPWETP